MYDNMVTYGITDRNKPYYTKYEMMIKKLSSSYKTEQFSTIMLRKVTDEDYKA